MYQVAGLGAQTLLTDELPQFPQINHVGAQRLRRRILRRGAHDESTAVLRSDSPVNHSAEALALSFILDARRHADSPALGHEHQVSGGQSDVGGQPGTLGSQRILDDLHQNFIAFGDQRTDIFGVRRLDAGIGMPGIKYVRGVQERGALQADIDEGRLHARQHPGNPAFVDVADQSTAAGPLQKHLLQHAVFDDGRARLVGTAH